MPDSEEAISELTRRYDREKILLHEENKKLGLELDTVSDILHFKLKILIFCFIILMFLSA